MKAVIFAGGYGSRLSEETLVKPKPMIEIGTRPILWHIMKLYSHYQIQDFIVCLGYKGHVIKEYFANYHLNQSDFTLDMCDHSIQYHGGNTEAWRVTLIDTGEGTETGGRIQQIQHLIGNETFCLTYGDGLGDINITELIHFHQSHGKYASVTAVQPPGRFGSLSLQDQLVVDFTEKSAGDGGWINGGFFVLEPEIFPYIKTKTAVWETDVLVQLAKEQQLMAYKHAGFWSPMDTLRDKKKLVELWDRNQSPWKVWGHG